MTAALVPWNAGSVHADEGFADAPPRDLHDHLAMLVRRRRAAMLAGLCIMSLAASAAFLMPPVYRSSATILVQEQEIPQDLVRATITTFADQRIQVISQQVMTRQVLLALADKYRLYARERRFETNEEILERMRGDIRLSTVTARVSDRRLGGMETATIAFQLSYEAAVPANAQKVVNDLVSLYLNENVNTRVRRSAETTAFLSAEAERLRTQISSLEARIARFKERHQGRLPESSTFNTQSIDRAENEVTRIEREIAAAKDRKAYLEDQIAQARELSRVPEDRSANRVLEPSERLRLLQDELASLTGNYADSHPDVQRVRREIAALRVEVGDDAGHEDIARRIDEKSSQVSALAARYASQHPDLVRARAELDSLEEAQRRSLGDRDQAMKRKAAARPTRAETRFTINLRAQSEAASREIESLLAQKREVQQKITRIEGRLEQAPAVEREYRDMLREYENATARHREVGYKQMTAQVAEELEKDSKGERFTLIDPAQLPERPLSPNRPLILVVGLLLAVIGGVGWASLLEAFDRSVRGVRDLARLASVPVLGEIPHVLGPFERTRRQMRRRVAAVSTIVVLAMALLAVHEFYRPLPDLVLVAWSRLHLR